MARCRVDQSIQRVEMNGFAFPLGVYPVDPIEPKAAYTMAFEPADDGSGPGPQGSTPDAGGGSEGEWEEWPDRYVYDILVPINRLPALVRTLVALLPGRVYPILDFLGQDEWREVDPYVSYDHIGLDRFMESIRRFGPFFFEDGLIGFGAMSDEPFLYVFVDEHKVVTVRAETALKDKIEGVLSAFDLEQVDEIHSADSATHEHRGVLETPDNRPDLFSAEEIVEILKDDWRLVLNVDADRNVDEDGNTLGIVGWRCIIRFDPAGADDPATGKASSEEEADRPASSDSGEDSSGKEEDAEESMVADPTKAARPSQPPPSKYLEIFLTANSLNQATDLAVETLEEMLGADGIEIDPDQTPEPVMVQADRWGSEDFVVAVEKLTGQKPDMSEPAVRHATWLN